MTRAEQNKLLRHAKPAQYKDARGRHYAENRSAILAVRALWREQNREKTRAAQRAERLRNPEKVRARIRKEWSSAEKWPRHAWRMVRKRAQNKGLPFDLTPADLVVPGVCPVLGTAFTFGPRCPTNPSVDRKDNSKGYTRDNVRIISYRANQIKNDATAQELRAVIRYMEK